MRGDFTSFDDLKEATLGAKEPLKVRVWLPDRKFSRLRGIEIPRVGWTQAERQRFRKWERRDVVWAVREYIEVLYDLPGENTEGSPIDYLYAIKLDIEWMDRRWAEREIGVLDGK
jgi:hypothetical protein